MRTLLVSYDLVSPVKNYQPLWDFLQSFNRWAKPVASLYLLKTDFTAEELRNNLRDNYLDIDDKVIVIDVTGRTAAWLHLADKVSTWIKSNL